MLDEHKDQSSGPQDSVVAHLSSGAWEAEAGNPGASWLARITDQ